MKVLQINAYNYHRGGSETVFFNTIDMLRRHGHEVATFTLKWPENLPSPYEKYYAESKVSRHGILKPIKNIVNYFYHFEAASKLERLIRDFKPDVAQIHLIWGQLTPSILTVLNKWHIPAILTIHDFRIICPASTCRNGRGEVCEKCGDHNYFHCVSNTCCKGSKMLSLMMTTEQYFRNAFLNPARMSDGMIFVSDFIKNKHYDYFPKLKEIPAIRLYNLAKHFSDKPRLSEQSQGYLLYFGRLTFEKGLLTMIDAFDILNKKYGIRTPLKIAGRGDMEAEASQKAEKLGLKNIEFVGFKSGDELTDLISGASFVILPSECLENNPLSVIEANALGVPVIGAAIGGIPEIISPSETGFLFKTRCATSMAETIAEALKMSPDDYARMCANAQNFAHDNFSEGPYYDRLISFYKQVIDSTSKSRGINRTTRNI